LLNCSVCSLFFKVENVTSSHQRSYDELETSPSEVAAESKILKLPGDVCKHCNKRCTAKGKQSEAIQCEICHSWVHSSCEGISKEHYKSLNQLFQGIPNLIYCCKLNQCHLRFGQLLGSNTSVNSKTDQNIQALAEQSDTLKKSVSQIGSQIEAISKANAELNDKFTNLLKTHSQQEFTKPTEFSASTTTTIANELAERDRKKNNVIVYNFPE